MWCQHGLLSDKRLFLCQNNNTSFWMIINIHWKFISTHRRYFNVGIDFVKLGLGRCNRYICCTEHDVYMLTYYLTEKVHQMILQQYHRFLANLVRKKISDYR